MVLDVIWVELWELALLTWLPATPKAFPPLALLKMILSCLQAYIVPCDCLDCKRVNAYKIPTRRRCHHKNIVYYFQHILGLQNYKAPISYQHQSSKLQWLGGALLPPSVEVPSAQKVPTNTTDTGDLQYFSDHQRTYHSRRRHHHQQFGMAGWNNLRWGNSGKHRWRIDLELIGYNAS